MQNATKRNLLKLWNDAARVGVTAAIVLAILSGANDWAIYRAQLSDQRAATHVMLAGNAPTVATASGALSVEP